MVGWQHFGQSEKFLRGIFSEKNMSVEKRNGLYIGSIQILQFPAIRIDVSASEQKPTRSEKQGLTLTLWHKIRSDESESCITKEDGFWQTKGILSSNRAPIAYLDLAISTPENYYTLWSSTLKNHRNKWLRNIADGKTEIKKVAIDEFILEYKKSDIKKNLLDFYSSQAYAMHDEYQGDMHFYLIYSGSKIVAGTCILDDNETAQSIYQYMFCDKSKEYKYVGVGIIDFCIKHAFEKGFHYLNLTAIYQKGQPKSWKGLTAFKMQFHPKISTCRNLYVRLTYNKN